MTANMKDVLYKLADAFYQAADALRENEVEDAVEETAYAQLEEPTPIKGEGSLAQCPKHRIPYKDGKYGLFCSQQTNEPDWGKERDGTLWCRITPKNAAIWLRQHA